jgi:uncharacterized protein DUF6602
MAECGHAWDTAGGCRGSRAIRTTLEHGGEIGRGHEKVLAAELQQLLPERIAIRTGFVLGAGGTISKQLDLVLCDRSNYPSFTYGAGDLIIPDSVLGVISVKTSLLLHELPLYFREAAEFKGLMAQVLGQRGLASMESSPIRRKARSNCSSIDFTQAYSGAHRKAWVLT